MTETNTVWSLSGFGDEVDPDPAVQAAVLQALGASHIEVRSAWGPTFRKLSRKGSSGSRPSWTIWETVDSPSLRVAWDSDNFVQVGVKPYTEAYAVLRPYLDATIAALKADGLPASFPWNRTLQAPTNWADSPDPSPSALPRAPLLRSRQRTVLPWPEGL